jgi:murein DD-endopeptidase MepM/ murein hydrolase activator NlpD
MKKITIMIIPDDVSSTRQVSVPRTVFKLFSILGLGLFGLVGYFVFDYMQLRALRPAYTSVSNENQGLKGEARVLMQNLEEVKRSLRRVQDYTAKLGELTSLQFKKVRKETGIGPLSPEEFGVANAAVAKDVNTKTADYVPLGVNMDSLTFQPVFNRLSSIGEDANKHALELQHLLSNLSQQKSLLSSIPAVTPVDGWVTSGYGSRVSPFTGDKSLHLGIDVAAPVGTPILAPADGVVIFTGAKDGFGNFIMIAHGYGIVTRYGHNHQNMVQPGQKITRGEQIGTVGMTGRTTGPHLHYEVWVNGKTENPKKFILNMDDFSVY